MQRLLFANDQCQLYYLYYAQFNENTNQVLTLPLLPLAAVVLVVVMVLAIVVGITGNFCSSFCALLTRQATIIQQVSCNISSCRHIAIVSNFLKKFHTESFSFSKYLSQFDISRYNKKGCHFFRHQNLSTRN